MKKEIKFFVEYFFLFYLVIFFRAFPLKVALKIASIFGKIFFYINRTHRKRAMENLTLSFPEKSGQELLNLCKRVYVHLAKVFMEFIFLPIMKNKNFRIIGEENLKKALQKQKGIVAVTGHIGNWELLGAIVVEAGYPLAAVYHPMKNPYSDKFFNNIRKKVGIELIPIKDSLRGAIRALNSNKLLGLIADQDAGKSGIFVKFFKREASTAKGPAIFAAKTGAPMILFILIREKDDSYTLYISKSLKIKHNIYDDTKLWSDELEKWIRKYPEQWFWVHRKWHTKKKS